MLRVKATILPDGQSVVQVSGWAFTAADQVALAHYADLLTRRTPAPPPPPLELPPPLALGPGSA